MEYKNPFRDAEWEEALKSKDVISVSDFQGLQGPPIGNLVDLMYANSTKFDESRLLTWLMRDHGFSRFRPMPLTSAFLSKWKQDNKCRHFFITHYCYPILETEIGISIGMCHPLDNEMKEGLARYFPHFDFTDFVALTPAEAANLHHQFLN